MPASFRPSDSRRRLPLFLATALLAAPAVPVPAAPAVPVPAARAQTTDLVLVTVAGLRADRLRSTVDGTPLMPVLGGLARRGTLLERAWTPVPEPLPAAASVMTGLGPGRHGVRPDTTGAVAPPTLARLLAAANFETRAFVAGSGMQALLADFAGAESLGDADATRVVDRALAALAALPAGRRSFLWIHLADPLPPLQPDLDGWLDLIALGRNEAWDFRLPLVAEPARSHTLFGGSANGPLRRAALYLDAYDAVLRSVDTQIGRLLASLEQDPRRAGTLVAIASLHGLGLGEHNLWLSYGDLLYEEDLAVPLVLLGPGVRAARPTDTTASLLDIAPTALARLGLPQARDRFEGADLSPLLDGRGPAPERPMFAAQLRAPWRRAALTADGLKLILTPPPTGSGRSGQPSGELYDLKSDPIEAFRIDGLRVTVANEMIRWVEETFPALPGTPPAEDESRRR